jgi:hypothetical protein
VNDFIGEYARLSVAAERLQKMGRPVPPKVIHRMQVIEATAKTRLPPHALEAAMQHVEAAKMRLLSEAEAHAREQHEKESQVAADAMARRLTRGWLGEANGLSAEQFRAVRDGKPITIKSERPPQARVDEAFRKRIGMSEAEYLGTMNRQTEANESEFFEKAAELKVNPDDLRRYVRKWNEGEGLAYELKKRRAGDGSEDEKVTPDADTRRRAQVVDAFIEHAEQRNDPSLIPDSDRISREYLTDDSSHRGAIARAMEASERGVDIREVEAEVRSVGADA